MKEARRVKAPMSMLRRHINGNSAGLPEELIQASRIFENKKAGRARGNGEKSTTKSGGTG